ncbi:MAG: UDP-N-acetylglucosamine 4,6-dehydratase (inverting) [Terriglobales bacterium]
MGFLDDQVVLVTGGTGSFGRAFVDTVLREHRPKKLIVLSRDELKQHEMRQMHPDGANSPMRYFIGDVRDRDRLYRAFADVDIVVHAAALKQVPACEYNPIEAIQTNVVGARNVIDAAIDKGVRRAVAVSTDKAVNPVNLYGATKLCAEKLFIHGNAYSGETGCRFSVARYGNVLGSRGSVIPLFQEQHKNGRLLVTDRRMTRFWLTLQQGVHFVLRCIELMHGGEIFVPKVPSMSIVELARTLAPGSDIEYVGIRPGEKLHEVLVSEDEARLAIETDDMYVILPPHHWWRPENWAHAKPVPDGFRYTSDTNQRWLTPGQMLALLEDTGANAKRDPGLAGRTAGAQGAAAVRSSGN